MVAAVAFATFVSVATATAEEAGDAPPAQPAGTVVVLVPAERAAPPTEVPATEPAEEPAESDPPPAEAPAPEPAAEATAEPEPAPAAKPEASPPAQPATAPATAPPAAPEPEAPQSTVQEDAPPAAPSTPQAAPKLQQEPTPQVRSLAARANMNACQGNSSYCKVVPGPNGTWVVSDSVNVCHATSGNGSSGFGFNLITPNADAVLVQGNDHGSHSTPNFWTTSYSVGDIVEAFSYGQDLNSDGTITSDEVSQYPGRNLGSTAEPANVSWATIYGSAQTGAAILGSGCVATTPPEECPDGQLGSPPNCVPEPPVANVEVEVCHRSPSGAFSLATWTIVGGDVTAGHGADAQDIIPAFDYVSGYVPNGTSDGWIPVNESFAARNLATIYDIDVTGLPFPIQVSGQWLLDNDCSAPGEPPLVQHVEVSLCHANQGSGSGFYSFITVDDDAVVGGGHDGDEYDVIPSFEYPTGYEWDSTANDGAGGWVLQTETYPGKNLGTFTRPVNFPGIGTIDWEINGQDLLDSGDCSFTPPTPEPPVEPTPVTLCHAQAVDGFDTWVQVSTDSDGVLGSPGHDEHGYDVIPPFEYVVDFTYDVESDSWTPVTETYDGKNLGEFTRPMDLPGVGIVERPFVGEELLQDGCAFAAVPPQPPVTPTVVSLCHAAIVDGFDTYVPVISDTSGVLALGGHAEDEFDIIPEFEYVTAYVYEPSTNSWTAQTATYSGKNLGTFDRTLTLASGTTTVTLDGAAMLASGTCALPAIPETPDVTPPTPETPDVTPPTPETPTETPTEEEPTIVDVETDEPTLVAAEAAEPTGVLPFTGLQLGVLALLAIAAIAAGTAAHDRRRQPRAK